MGIVVCWILVSMGLINNVNKLAAHKREPAECSHSYRHQVDSGVNEGRDLCSEPIGL